MLTLETKNNIVLSNDPVSIIVDKRDWVRLKRTVSKCKYQTDWWLNVGFAFFGIAGSAAITAFSLLDDKNAGQTTLVLWLVSGFTAIIGVICCIAHNFSKNVSTSSIEDINTAIGDIEANIKQEE